MGKSTVNLGVIGCGTVGGSFIKAVSRQRKHLLERTGIDFSVTGIYDKDPEAMIGFPHSVRRDSADSIIRDPSIDIVVELIGGVNPACDITSDCFRRGKSVVNANKALICEKGRELLSLAGRSGVYLGFEAAVAGAVPVIKAIRESFLPNRISRILGILNGTTNYILSEMSGGKTSFSRSLARAQKAGYAEADPSLDVSGWDTAHKISILSMLAFNRFIPPESLYVEGIEGVEPLDIRFAGEFGYRLKLLAVARRHNSKIELRVHPVLLPESHLLSMVEGVNNAVYIEGDMMGKGMLYGEGAGGEAAASAVLADVVDISRRLLSGGASPERTPVARILSPVPMSEIATRYYFRFTAVDKPGVLSEISRLLGIHGISIASVIQKEESPEKAVPLVMLTHRALEQNVIEAISKIDSLPVIKNPTKLIRIEE